MTTKTEIVTDSSSRSNPHDESAASRVASWLRSELRERLQHVPAPSYRAQVDACVNGHDMHLEEAAGTVNRIALHCDATIGFSKPESYTLEITAHEITLCAGDYAGLFYSAQTLLQLVQPVSADDVMVPLCTINDEPRFPYRGVMIDVARHFLPTTDLKKVIKEISAFKINYLHLHLTDDQGWRVEIPEYPELTELSSHSGVGGTGGGFYTCEDIAELVDWGKRHNVELVPEIDMPGHTAAAAHALPALNAIPYQENGQSADHGAQLSEGTDVNISALAVDREFTFEWVSTVLTRIADMFPGQYLHVGGDEAEIMGRERYSAFISRMLPLASETGKSIVAWNDIGAVSQLPVPVIGQYWMESPGSLETIRHSGGKIIMSPPARTYLDLKHTPEQELGVTWAGILDTYTAYAWEPSEMVSSINDDDILGIEAPLWTETVDGIEAVETMLFPRVCAVAERAWSPRGGLAGRRLSRFLERVAAQSDRWISREVSYFDDPSIPWQR